MYCNLRKPAHLRVWIGALLALTPPGVAQVRAETPESLTVEHVTLIDGSGRAPQPEMTVVIDGGRFQKVIPSALAKVVPGHRIDGRGMVARR
jgi:hypothetical protein